MTADVMLNFERNADHDLWNWRSDLTRQVDGITNRLFGKQSGQDSLADYASDMLHLPNSLGRTGVNSPSRSVTAAFAIPLMRSIRYAIKGIELKGKTVKLGTGLEETFKDWQTSDLPMFRALRACAVPMLPEIHIPKKHRDMDPLRYLVEIHPISQLQSALTVKLYGHIKTELLADDFSDSALLEHVPFDTTPPPDAPLPPHCCLL